MCKLSQGRKFSYGSQTRLSKNHSEFTLFSLSFSGATRHLANGSSRPWCRWGHKRHLAYRFFLLSFVFTPPRNRGGVNFYYSLSMCKSLCVCVWVSGTSCEQNSSRTDEPILMRFALNGCLHHWLGPYWNCGLESKVKVTVTQYPFFLHNSLLTSLLYISVLLCLIKLKFLSSMHTSYSLQDGQLH